MAMPASPKPEARLLSYSRWALMLTVGGLPTYVVRWRYGPLPTTFLETLILVTVALYLVARWRDGWRRPLSTAYDAPIFFFLLAGAISVFVAIDHRGALGLYRAYFVEPVAIFYVAVDLLRRADHLRNAIVALAIGSSAFALLNIATFAKALAEHHVNVGSAPSALYGDANYVAMYLEPPVALAAGLLLFGTSGMWRRVGAAWLLICGLALILTFSKGTYVALCVAAAVTVLSVSSWRLRGALVAVFIAAVLVATRVPLIAQRLSSTGVSLTGRFQLVSGALQILRDHPVFGLGLGGYHTKLYGITPEAYPHDVWLTFWVEVGVLGLVTFGLILFTLLARGWRSWPRVTGFYRPALWGVLMALVIWTVHGLVDSPYWKNDMSAEFWILAAIEVVAIGSLARAAGKITADAKHIPTLPEPA